VARKGALEDQDYKRLGKGGIDTKNLQINHPTNASIGIHSGRNPREPTFDVRVIWTTKN